MTEKINTGTILIKEGTLFPEGLKIISEPYSKGWRLVKNLDRSALDRQLCEARWTFFYMASGVEATAVGFDLEKMKRRAIKGILSSMKSGKLNCLEIVQVATSRFLGLPYVTVSTRQRHIQESMYLFHTKHLAELDQATLEVA